LLAALLAHEAVVSITGPGGTRRSELAEFLADGRPDRARIITGVTVCTSGAASAARTARTRTDQPIVAVVAALPRREWRLALEGVALRRL
jgi:CO/xanthine dehydrogenase FAD-binding subunit